MLALRPFGQSDDETLIGWIRSADELLTFGGPELAWPLDGAQLAQIRARADTLAWTAVLPPSCDPVGHVELVIRPEYPGRGHIARVIIDPAYRRSGLGREMIEAVLAVARARGLRQATLNVRRGNDAAVALYRQLGFREMYAGHRAGAPVSQMAMLLDGSS